MPHETGTDTEIKEMYMVLENENENENGAALLYFLSCFICDVCSYKIELTDA
jgi:hypothetical protein